MLLPTLPLLEVLLLALAAPPELTLSPPPPQADSAAEANKQTHTALLLIASLRDIPGALALFRLLFDGHRLAIKNMSPARDGAAQQE
jgi:hypothetical protein